MCVAECAENYCIILHAGTIGLAAVTANQSLGNTGTRESQKEAQKITWNCAPLPLVGVTTIYHITPKIPDDPLPKH